jgi:hypothetical protein
MYQENSSPPTPSTRKVRPLPGPSPLSLKRSASFENNLSASDRPRKRRTRSSNTVFPERVSTLLEQALSIYKGDEENKSSPSEGVSYEDTTEEFAFDGDLDLLEAELQFDPLSSDGLEKIEVESSEKISNQSTNSDELFDITFDDLDAEELDSLDLSSRFPTMSEPQIVRPDEDDVLFGDGYDELMDLDFDQTQPEVKKIVI